ncbi:MAG TPA: DUF998 domain-containing protein [Chloroflexota bacterium]|nr:DUF998 domain-containing protein [Chloroflexota bacterium]
MAALAGVAVPLWFFGATLVFGALRDGYDPLVDAISELGQEGGRNALAWNVLGFGGTALLHALFAAAAWRSLASDAKGRWVAGLLAFAALALAASGAFRCDPGCPELPGSLLGMLHNVAGLAYFATMTVLPLVAGRLFAARPEWAPLARATLYAGAALVALFLAGPVLGPARVGAWQRAFLLLSHAWLAALSVRLYVLLPAARARHAVQAYVREGHPVEA